MVGLAGEIGKMNISRKELRFQSFVSVAINIFHHKQDEASGDLKVGLVRRSRSRG